jgi:nucleoporin p58/p45
MYFKEQKAIGAGIDTETVGGAIWQTSGDVKVASDENEALTQGLYALKQSLDVLGAKVAAETADLTRLVETWEAARPQPHGAIRPVTRDFAQDYFSRVANGLDERVARYKRNIAVSRVACIVLCLPS